MAWIDVLGNDIYYVEAGSGPPLVFLHGMSSCAEAWWQQFDYFANHYRVIAYDSVNHGHSSNSPAGQAETDRTDELEAFLAALEIEQPILAGNSMGGATILRWAVRHPDAARALVVSGMGVRRDDDGRGRQLSPLDHETLFLPIGDALTDRFKREEPIMFERYLRIRSTATRLEFLRRPRERNPRTVEETLALAERVGGVRSPLLAIVGELDSLKDAAMHLDELVSHSRYVELAGSPHNGYFENADEWNAAVDAFLTTID